MSRIELGREGAPCGEGIMILWCGDKCMDL